MDKKFIVVGCTQPGCDKSFNHPEGVPIFLPPEGWSHHWSDNKDPKIGHIEEGFYCTFHGQQIERRVAQGHSPVPPERRSRRSRR